MLIRTVCAAKRIPLRDNYPDPQQLAGMVLADLNAAIEAVFPREIIPDPLSREVRDHEAYAETRRRTYIGRPDYFTRIDDHAAGDGAPLALLGDAGSGKSALLANWVAHWRKGHAGDFIIQHYIGSTPDSIDAVSLMRRVMAEIKRWTDDQADLPRERDDVLREFPRWLACARSKAAQDAVHCILVLDALNQLAETDHARLLGWLPTESFTGPLRLVVSTLPGEPERDDPLAVIRQRGWETLQVEPLAASECESMIIKYLERFSKRLDAPRLARLAGTPAAACPLYLKILLDELRVTGTYDRLDERLDAYLAAQDIPLPARAGSRAICERLRA